LFSLAFPPPFPIGFSAGWRGLLGSCGFVVFGGWFWRFSFGAVFVLFVAFFGFLWLAVFVSFCGVFLSFFVRFWHGFCCIVFSGGFATACLWCGVNG